MASPFAITAASNTVLLDNKRQAQTTFTVSNLSGRALRARARLVAQDSAAASWLSLVGDAERDLPIAGTQQYVVQIAVPPTGPAGSYPFRLDVVGVENPDEMFAQGASVTFSVPEPEAKKPFPIWIPIAAVVAVLVLVIGFAGYRVIQGQNEANATATARAEGTRTAIAEATGTAIANATAAQVAANETATAIANATGTALAELNAATQTALANATATQLAANATATQLAADAAATQVAANAQATQAASQTAVAAAASKYNGTWYKDDKQLGGLARLVINSAGPTITVDAAGDVRDIITSSGGIAQTPCSQALCSWGTQKVSYVGDPLTITFKMAPQLSHIISLSVTTDRSTLTVTDKTIFNGRTSPPLPLTFHRSCPTRLCKYYQIEPLRNFQFLQIPTTAP